MIDLESEFGRLRDGMDEESEREGDGEVMRGGIASDDKGKWKGSHWLD